jgi:hypothetical protein
MLAAAEHPTMTKQERQRLPTFLAQIRRRCLARPAGSDMRRHMTLHQLANQLLDRRWRAVDLSKIPDLTIAPDIGDRHRVLLLRRVKSDEGFACGTLQGPLSSSSRMESGSAEPHPPHFFRRAAAYDAIRSRFAPDAG